MVKVRDITLEEDWEDIVRAKLREIGFKDGYLYRYAHDGEVQIRKSIPIFERPRKSWLEKSYKIGRIDGTKADQIIFVYGSEFLQPMTQLAEWIEDKFSRTTIVVLRSQTKKRADGGIVRWLQDVFGNDA